MKPTLTKGENLTPTQKKQVISAFVHRYTGEHFPEWASRPMPNGEAYKPTHATDSEWINDHAFYINKNGFLASYPTRCEPVYMVRD